MKIYSETSLRNFQFWDGAKDRAEQLTSDQLDRIESILEMDNPDGMEDTEINDIFWFEEDWIANILGYSSWENLEAGIDKEMEAEIDRINEEIEDLEVELHELTVEYNDLASDLTEEESKELWETEYKEQDADLREQIHDLYEELDEISPEPILIEI